MPLAEAVGRPLRLTRSHAAAGAGKGATAADNGTGDLAGIAFPFEPKLGALFVLPGGMRQVPGPWEKPARRMRTPTPFASWPGVIPTLLYQPRSSRSNLLHSTAAAAAAAAASTAGASIAAGLFASAGLPPSCAPPTTQAAPQAAPRGALRLALKRAAASKARNAGDAGAGPGKSVAAAGRRPHRPGGGRRPNSSKMVVIIRGFLADVWPQGLPPGLAKADFYAALEKRLEEAEIRSQNLVSVSVRVRSPACCSSFRGSLVSRTCFYHLPLPPQTLYLRTYAAGWKNGPISRELDFRGVLAHELFPTCRGRSFVDIRPPCRPCAAVWQGTRASPEEEAEGNRAVASRPARKEAQGGRRGSRGRGAAAKEEAFDRSRGVP